ncbi:hypothetical protein ABVK25_010097 [Lepraria finkii]|uniref:Solute carrier family 40 member n=1 Tax=Lepraria finkii TaxID=1340010 RepID=A0ABR4AXI3_9LECA
MILERTFNANDPMQLSLHGYLTVSSAHLARGLVLKIVSEVLRSIRAYVNSLQDYFNTAEWIPSVCAAIPHASVLTFSGIIITYLLNAGLSLNMVTGARASGATFEIGSTFVFPWAVGILSSATEHTTNGHGMKECHFLDAGNPSSRVDNSSREEEDQDLDSKQNIPDPEGGVTLVPATHHSSFGGTEVSVVSIISLAHWIAAAVWNTQNDFRWLALGSFVMVGIA